MNRPSLALMRALGGAADLLTLVGDDAGGQLANLAPQARAAGTFGRGMTIFGLIMTVIAVSSSGQKARIAA